MTGKIFKHYGMCDASGGIALDDTRFVVANDEDNVLRVYKTGSSGASIQEIDVGGYLKNLPVDPDKSEADIEAAALLDKTVYWITSHSRNKNGKKRPARHNLFAQTISTSNGTVTSVQVEKSYTKLLAEMANDKNLNQYNLKEAGQIAPKEKGGLNIEGLTATPNESLLIGFRNPIPNGKALLVPMLNPAKVIKGESAKFGQSINLDMDNLGVRSIEYWVDRNIYLIIAGPYNNNGNSKLYQWSGNAKGTPVEITDVGLSGLNPEAIIIYPGITDKVQVLSDDGTVKHDNTECKDLPQGDKRKCFRSMWVTI